MPVAAVDEVEVEDPDEDRAQPERSATTVGKLGISLVPVGHPDETQRNRDLPVEVTILLLREAIISRELMMLGYTTLPVLENHANECFLVARK